MPGENEFDMDSALSEISDGLGLGEESTNGGVATADDGLDALLPEDGTPTVAEPASAEPASTEPAPAPSAAPRTWRQEAAAEWAKLPPSVQAEVIKREEDMFRGIESYKADASFGKVVKGILDPYMPTLQQYGIDPAQQVQNLMSAHYKLALGSPEEKTAMFFQLAKDYGIQLGPQGETPYIDPTVQVLQTELHGLKSSLQMREAREASEIRSKLTSEIETFASNPANQYFNEVADDMAVLLRSGAAKDLADAYEKATWANPVTRAKEQARLQAETEAKLKKEAEAKAAAARRTTAANIRTKPKAASGTAPLGSIEATLNETLAAIHARG